ncbi:M1 family metallopeptidase [Micromonospora sp. HM5-17]|uniref:M1 family metallopeptidase n=1 Tax=Micromonospora sp. HM5-17 TaxID=2487710 RepID=UPI000F49CD89|nr:M1 family metallopeptidase [Micromonospora sp. HM5-17]ROT34241.1 M1 family peptidase [Micromonospora sp. HM5-17]
MTRRHILAAALVTALALSTGGCIASRGDDGPDRFRPGAAGLGDPYLPTAGNGGYDVLSYHLRLRYDPATDQLTGDATIEATATQNLSRFNLDLAGLTVSSVRIDDAEARHHRDGAELVVTPAAGIAEGRRFRVRVGYAGTPTLIESSDLGTGGLLHTADGAIALGQPESASSWFPVNDHPRDKATYRIEVTVPDGLVALSNGVPEGTERSGGWTTWRWSESSPMASYLATLVIGNYRVSTGSHAGRPLVTAVAATLPAGGAAERSLARTGEIADFLASRFGPYPFAAYGGIAVADERIGYALETQTRPVYGPAFFTRGPNPTVVAHELAHQWFGDSLSIRSWRDLWLNEGFATYAEWLWTEHEGGESAQQAFEREYAATDWSQPALDPGREALFGRAVYQRGALTVHALRRTVGDDVFFRILRDWAAQRRDGTVDTAEFVAFAERVSGRSLTAFFDAWLTGTTAPPRP